MTCLPPRKLHLLETGKTKDLTRQSSGQMRASATLHLPSAAVFCVQDYYPKLILNDTKSGKEAEVAFLPQKVADRLKKYISDNGIEPGARIFPITYAAARIIVKKAGELVGIHLKPHDLRRHAATYASRSGTPLEIVSKVLLRHSNLSITQRYLGKISDVEAMRWIDKLHG